jgi:pantoate ligase / CMP/dCMP kinase
MRVFSTIAGLRTCLHIVRYGTGDQSEIDLSSRPQYSTSHLSIGLVPTMGALHDGHLSLIRQARYANHTIVVSIFVNPLQFGPQEDYQRYPRTLERDCQVCAAAGVDVVFAPNAQELGVQAEHSRTQDLKSTTTTLVVPPLAMTQGLCGRFRPGHFEGVATIVTKLLQLVQPDRVYFGQKDAQQLAIIRHLVADLNIPTDIIGCPTVREPSGLALSSRNQYLSPDQKIQAAGLYQSLHQASLAFRAGEANSTSLIGVVKDQLTLFPGLQPEYIELVDPLTLIDLEHVEEQGLLAVAARIGSTRLIDNVMLSKRRPIVAIDGPAGAGKSTVARMVAEELEILYLDTGAMYRAVTWLVLQSGIDISDEAAIAELVSQSQIELCPEQERLRVLINDQDVTQAIRSWEVTSQVSEIAAQPAVRQALVRQQQRYGHCGGIVIEGRDIGTYVFPDAELKIFLTASVQERARRRQLDLKHQGKENDISLDALEQAIFERDRRDSVRALAPLQRATDAIELQTDGLSIQNVVERILELYRHHLTVQDPSVN